MQAATSLRGRRTRLVRTLAPFLIFRGLLPLLVRFTRADEVHVGAYILAALGPAFAGAIDGEAEIVRRQALGRGDVSLMQVTALETDRIRSGDGSRIEVFRQLGNFLHGYLLRAQLPGFPGQ